MGTHRSGPARRTAGGIALALLAAALITGCSGGDGPAESASSSGSASASASSSPSETASAQPSASDGSTATPSGSESPLPDDWRPQEPTVLATGQKVPDDYEPATLDHPARNVPKPVMPEEAKNETEAGAQAFLNYRADAQWYSIQTGDTSLVREVTSTDCEKCTEQFDAFDSMYQKGNWAAGGFEVQKIKTGSFIKRADGGYNLPVDVKSSGSLSVVNGKIPRRQLPFETQDSFDAYVYRENGHWMYLTGSPRGAM